MKHKLGIRLINHWDAFEDWHYNEKFEELHPEESTFYEEDRDVTSQDLIDFLTEKKYSINDALKCKNEIPLLYDDLKTACDEYRQKLLNGLIVLWKK